MLRITIGLLILIHGIIHLVGFLNEWNLKKLDKFNGLTLIELPPALLKTFGLLWLVACFLFIGIAALYYLKNYTW